MTYPRQWSNTSNAQEPARLPQAFARTKSGHHKTAAFVSSHCLKGQHGQCSKRKCTCKVCGDHAIR